MEYIAYLKSLFLVDPITKVCITFICTLLINTFGESWVAYQALLVLVVIDALMLIMLRAKEKNSSEPRFFKKLGRLLTYWLLILAAYQVERVAPITGMMQTMAIFVAVNELHSIFENSYRLGVKVPAWIVDKLEISQKPGI